MNQPFNFSPEEAAQYDPTSAGQFAQLLRNEQNRFRSLFFLNQKRWPEPEAFAASLGLSLESLNGWINGTRRPTWAEIAGLPESVRIPARKILFGG